MRSNLKGPTNGSGGRSNEEDTDSLDESSTGSDMDTDDEGEGHANEHHVGTAGFEPPQRLYGSTEKALENGCKVMCVLNSIQGSEYVNSYKALRLVQICVGPSWAR
jgi:hypothetical protein